jgi:hypothetical protein
MIVYHFLGHDINRVHLKSKNFAPGCGNIIKMIRVTFWVLVFAKTQKGSFIESTKTQKPHT